MEPTGLTAAGAPPTDPVAAAAAGAPPTGLTAAAITVKQRAASIRAYEALFRFFNSGMDKISAEQDRLLRDRMTLHNMSPAERRATATPWVVPHFRGKPWKLDSLLIRLSKEQAEMLERKSKVISLLATLAPLDYPEEGKLMQSRVRCLASK
jgi:hypothetical protein